MVIKMRKKKHFLAVLLLIGALFLASSCQRSADDSYQLIHQNHGEYRYPVWSPDGRQLLYLQGPGEKFVILDIETGLETELTINTEGTSGPLTTHWPQDAEISYSLSFREPSNKIISSLAVYNLSSGEEQTILSNDRIYKACWSSPTKVYVFITRKPADDRWIVGNTLTIYDPQENTLISLFSPRYDERIIDLACDQSSGLVVAVLREGDTTRSQSTLAIIDIETGDQRNIFTSAQIDFDSPTWSPTGEWIAVRSLRGKADNPRPGIMLIPTENTGDQHEPIVVMEASVRITPADIVWSPIDNQILIRTRSGFRQYVLYTLDITSWLDDWTNSQQ
jgi:Tol biopolymer transport system component